MTASMTSSASVNGRFVDRPDGRYYCIEHYDQMPTFFMSVVSAGDLWLFVASNGGLTAGRRNAAHALFPYLTVDRVQDSAGISGPCTALRCSDGGHEILWEPFAAHTPRRHRVTRRLYKSIEGDRLWFEETNHDLELVFRQGWATSEEHGFVRRVELINAGQRGRRIQVLDGLRNLLAPGIAPRLQNEFSCLADAYKSAERVPGTTLAIYALAAGIIDQPVAVEALRATVVWSVGLVPEALLLADRQFSRFLDGHPVETETRRRGVRGAYGLVATLDLAVGEQRDWMIVADFGLSQADAAALALRQNTPALAEEVGQGVAEGTRRLRALVGAADGLQHGGDETTTAHHFANVLFNVMRGGVFAEGGRIPTADFADFVALRNRPAAARHRALLADLPETMPPEDLLERARATNDADLERLALEYLPLTFSRRHGDPSRPWNGFNIVVRDAAGKRVLNHEGNWRDIFQNWEALALSFPQFLDHFIAKFLNASTADGYNPCRLSRDRIEWDVPEEDNPWASIGYWGDHQVIYLLRLLEWSERFYPGRVQGWLRRERFAYADVPYRIAGYEEMRRNPRSTITFDAKRQRDIEEREAKGGTDARLIHGPDGRVRHANLTEKLLLLLLTRLTSFIPGGGIWMNSGRPEWNDANNALVGYGVSVVTLAHLRRFLAYWQSRLLPALGDKDVMISEALIELAESLNTAFQRHESLLNSADISAARRRALVDALASAGSAYRDNLYRDGLPRVAAVSPAKLRELTARALAFVDHTLRGCRREDGLYDSYNLLTFSESPPALDVTRLQIMLEGQVAVLGAGLLSPTETVALLDALRQSELYRADQHSYLLYPDRQLPGFLERNCIPAERVASSPLVTALLEAGDTRLVQRDVTGQVRFQSELISEAALNARLAELFAETDWAEQLADGADKVRGIYEEVFRHRAFTGRSGTMFSYEGLGCIYWHMVSKLLLAVQENLDAARASDDPAAPALAALYMEIRDGLGFRKSPGIYGAFPTDPYSHTPGHAGAQQPGMTGQVKEEIITRLGELGVAVDGGRVAFDPSGLDSVEFTAGPTEFSYYDVHGKCVTINLPAKSFGFTFCGTLVTYTISGGPRKLRLHFADGSHANQPNGTLSDVHSSAIFSRNGVISRVEVHLECPERLMREQSASPLRE